MKFHQWFAKRIAEDGLRTSLGIYPPGYGVGQYPPGYFMPMSGSALVSLVKIHHVKADQPAKPKKKKAKKKPAKKNKKK